MGFFDKVKERSRDRKRNVIYAALHRLGVDAEMAEDGRAEENIGAAGSLGLIDIAEGPIRWVNVRSIHKRGGPGRGSSTAYFCDYGVPDPRLGRDCPRVFIKSVRVKTYPFFGRVADVRWQGLDCGLGIINHLSSDVRLKDMKMSRHDVEIRAHGDDGCWIIRTKPMATLGPSPALWDCYQAIAHHLLAEWPPRVP